MAAIGQVIDDKYEILKLIGQGGMSKVYLAMDKRLNKQWAIKEIEKRARDKNNEIVIQSAIAEANMIKQLDHPSIVRIVDIIDNGNVIYIIEDYIEGETLSSVLEVEGEQSQEQVIKWSKQLCEALEYLHTRTPPIIYRDMKPANVMLKPDGNIKVIDFGIAREYKEHNSEDTVSLGTKGYAAPEQFGGKGQTDARTDVYCLGVTMYQLVTGHNPCEPPYQIYPIRHWNPQLSSGLEAIIQKCTQLNPADRYQSCAELIYALNHYEEYSLAYRATQHKKLNAFLATVIAMVVMVVFGCFGLFMRNLSNNADYEENIRLAQTASSSSEKMEKYLDACRIKPTEIEAYLGAISAIKEDAVFSTAEEKKLKSVVDIYLSSLQATEGYAELAFEIGKLYWYYYDYGKNVMSDDNHITRMTSAVKWFDDAANYGSVNDTFHNMAIVYRDIGLFKKEIVLNVEEASDKGKYLPFWNNLETLVNDIIKGGNESEIVVLETYKLVINTIEVYAYKLKSDGVVLDRIQALFNTVKADLNNLVVTSDKTEGIRNDVTSRLDSVQESINNTFREQVNT